MSMNDRIAVVDLSEIITSQYSSENSSVWQNVANEIRNALSAVGFMYLKNHGIEKNTIGSAFEASSNFFRLPKSIKSNYKKNVEVSSHGWVEAGQELLHPESVFELRECFDVAGRERKYPVAADQNLDFGEAMENLESEANKLIVKMLKLLELSLELEDSDYFEKCCSHLNNRYVKNECDLRAIYYPAIPENLNILPGTVRCAEHTDYEILTLLFQDDVGGLEIKTINDKWIPVPPIKDTIVVNTGDLLQFWTNGFYPATTHRVVIPEEEIRKRVPRYSIAYFFAPDDDTIVLPLKSKYCFQNATRATENKEIDTAKRITAYQHIMNRVKDAYQY